MPMVCKTCKKEVALDFTGDVECSCKQSWRVKPGGTVVKLTRVKKGGMASKLGITNRGTNAKVSETPKVEIKESPPKAKISKEQGQRLLDLNSIIKKVAKGEGDQIVISETVRKQMALDAKNFLEEAVKDNEQIKLLSQLGSLDILMDKKCGCPEVFVEKLSGEQLGILATNHKFHMSYKGIIQTLVEEQELATREKPNPERLEQVFQKLLAIAPHATAILDGALSGAAQSIHVPEQQRIQLKQEIEKGLQFEKQRKEQERLEELEKEKKKNAPRVESEGEKNERERQEKIRVEEEKRIEELRQKYDTSGPEQIAVTPQSLFDKLQTTTSFTELEELAKVPSGLVNLLRVIGNNQDKLKILWAIEGNKTLKGHDNQVTKRTCARLQILIPGLSDPQFLACTDMPSFLNMVADSTGDEGGPAGVAARGMTAERFGVLASSLTIGGNVKDAALANSRINALASLAQQLVADSIEDESVGKLVAIVNGLPNLIQNVDQLQWNPPAPLLNLKKNLTSLYNVLDGKLIKFKPLTQAKPVLKQKLKVY